MLEENAENGRLPGGARRSAALRVGWAVFFSLAAAMVWEGQGHGQIAVFFNRIFVAYNETADRGCVKDKIAANSVSYHGAGPTNGLAPSRIEFSPITSGAQTNPTGNFAYPGSCLSLCVQLGYNNETGANVPVDSMVMEVFKFLPGANPLDPGSTPPIRTFTFSAIGDMLGSNTTTTDKTNWPAGFIPIPVVGTLPGGDAARCAGWDGSHNIEGEFGRSNGQFGFRVTARTTRQHPTQGNISIETSPPGIFPGTEKLAGSQERQQEPITIDVVDFHVVRSSPSTVGSRPAVAVQPYNLRYRLSKDSIVDLDVYRCDSAGGNCSTLVRRILDRVPRVGEGPPVGTLTNGDFWDGRDDQGNLQPPGHYLVAFNAEATDAFNTVGVPVDQAIPQSRQIALDPLQITDIVLSPLGELSTSLATLSYTLTEDATVYVDIYPPGTSFSGQGSFTAGVEHNFNTTAPDATCFASLGDGSTARLPSSCLRPLLAGTTVFPLRTIREQKAGRTTSVSFWDGRTSTGAVLPDGNYVFAMYAAVPSSGAAGGTAFWPTQSVFTSDIKQGVLAINRGLPGITQVTPRTSVMGSSPAVAGLDPFTFSYSLTRDSIVSVKVYRGTDTNRNNPVKTLVNRETRQPGFVNTETWNDGVGDDGKIAAEGSYIVELTAEDPFFPIKVSTASASFPVSMLRLTNVDDSAILSGTTDQASLGYQLSRGMEVQWSIFPPGSQIRWSDPTKPPCQSVPTAVSGCSDVVASDGVTAVTPIFKSRNFRPGRPLRVTERWDGRTEAGVLVADGVYPYTLVAKSTDAANGSPYATDRVIGTLTVARGQILFQAFQVIPTVAQVFNSSEVVTLPPFEVDFALSRQSSVTVQVMNSSLPPQVVSNVLVGGIREGNILHREFWDGRDNAGNFVRAGVYTVRVVARDVSAQLIEPSTFQQSISVDPLVIYDVAISPITLLNANATFSYQVSESMKVAIKIFRPGTTFDALGNPSPPETTSLVRALVGVKPARTQVSDFWDGRDRRMTLVPDGNYLFKIVASTDLAAIDSITGDQAPGTLVAQGTVVSEIPVTRGGVLDAKTEFEENTIIYPNPVRTPSAVVRIRNPLRAKVTMKVYTLAGDLILDKDFGEKPPDSYIDFTWNRDNHAGRKVASGVYFFVIRQESLSGDRSILQAVKKVLVP